MQETSSAQVEMCQVTTGVGVEVPYPYPGKMPDYYRTLPDGTIKELSRNEYKEAMRKEWTVRRAAPKCGHRFTPGQEPRQRNCELCWFAFFQVHGEMTQACDEVFAKHGENGIRQLRGPKFAKNFLKFMSTLAQWKKIAEEKGVQDSSGNSPGTTQDAA